jgi:hypothetical protein
MTIIYLCGGINALSDAECVTWREEAKRRLPPPCFTCLDPLRRDYRGREAENVAAIIRDDLADIRASHVLLVNATRPSWGTAMEVFYAFCGLESRHIVAVCADAHPSPWLVGHTHTIVASFDDAYDYILHRYPAPARHEAQS